MTSRTFAPYQVEVLQQVTHSLKVPRMLSVDFLSTAGDRTAGSLVNKRCVTHEQFQKKLLICSG